MLGRSGLDASSSAISKLARLLCPLWDAWRLDRLFRPAPSSASTRGRGPDHWSLRVALGTSGHDCTRLGRGVLCSSCRRLPHIHEARPAGKGPKAGTPYSVLLRRGTERSWISDRTRASVARVVSRCYFEWW